MVNIIAIMKELTIKIEKSLKIEEEKPDLEKMEIVS